MRTTALIVIALVLSIAGSAVRGRGWRPNVNGVADQSSLRTRTHLGPAALRLAEG